MVGNSILKSRRRPRVHSVSFRTLFWLIPRVALLQILHGDSMSAAQSPLGVWIIRAPLAEVRRLGFTYLHRNTRRQIP